MSYARPSRHCDTQLCRGQRFYERLICRRNGYGHIRTPAKSDTAYTRQLADEGRSIQIKPLQCAEVKDRSTADPTMAQPHHPGCEPPEKQAITASGWSSMEPRSKALDKIEEGVRLSVEQRIWSCERGQSKIILFLYKDNIRSQRLGATLFLSYSSFFMISCRGEQTKQKRGPSQRKEKDLQRQRLLALFLFLAIFYESKNPPQRDPQNRIQKGGQGSRKSLPFFPVKIDGKELYQGHK
ncbi:hypothetical protein Tco_0273865 [Tanacetum coccineum]